MSCDNAVSSASYYGDELRMPIYSGLFPFFFATSQGGQGREGKTGANQNATVPWLWRGGLEYRLQAAVSAAHPTLGGRPMPRV